MASILLIDDLGLDLEIERTFLQRHEVRIETVEPDARPLDRARAGRPNLIVIDVHPPDFTGLGLCRQLRADPLLRSTPVIVVASRGTPVDPAAEGASALVHRPIVRGEFLDAVRRFVPLRERRSARCPVNLRFAYDTVDGHGQAFSRELSANGAFLKTDHAFVPGASLNLRFRLPGEENEIACRGIVRNARESGLGAHFGMGFGVEFEDMRPEDRSRLRRFVEWMLRRSVAVG